MSDQFEQPEQLKQQGMSEELTAGQVGGMPRSIKVKFKVKAVAFSMAVITLSWFFEGWRKIHEGLSFAHVGILLTGIVGTVLLVSLMSFWIYVEEKEKGTLVRRLKLFDSLHESMLNARTGRAESAQRKGTKREA